jgi:hypothetical protein
MRRMRSPCCALAASGHAAAVPPSSVMKVRALHSITSSARASRVMPSTLAAWTLITSSILVDCTIGKQASCP